MKRKTGIAAVSLILAGMITLNMFPLIHPSVKAEENDRQTYQTTASDMSKNDQKTDDGNTDDQKTDDGKGQKDPSNPPYKVIVDKEMLAQAISNQCTKVYDGNAKAEIVIQHTKVTQNDKLKYYPVFSYEKTAEGSEITKPRTISKFKVVGYFADENGQENADVLTNNGKEPAEKKFVVTDILFYDEGTYKSVKDFFKFDRYDSEDINQYICKGEYKANASYVFSAVLKPAKAECVLQADKIQYYNGQPIPDLVFTDEPKEKAYVIKKGQWTYYYTLDKPQLAPYLRFTFNSDHRVSVDITDEKVKNNYVLSFKNNKKDRVEYEVDAYNVPDTFSLKGVQYSVEAQDGETIVRKVKLFAPNGFLLSASNDEQADWKDNVVLEMDSENKVGYYVRSVSQFDLEKFYAVSDKQTWQAQAKLTAKSTLTGTVMDDGTDDPSIIKNAFRMYQRLFYTNKNLRISTELTNQFPTNGSLNYAVFTEHTNGSQTEEVREDRSIPFLISDWKLSEGSKYVLEKDIDIKVDNDMTGKYAVLSVSVPNYERVASVSLTDVNSRARQNIDQNKERQEMTIVIDKQPPLLEYTNEINTNNSKYKVKASDNSGTLKVMYRWDDLSYVSEQKTWEKANGENYVYANAEALYSEEDGAYFFDAEQINKEYPVSGGIHTLHIAATDVAGNTIEKAFKPSHGIDSLPPVMKQAQLVWLDRNHKPSVDAKGMIRNIVDIDQLITKDGILYANKAVGLLIHAEDGQSGTSDATDISVLFDGKELTETNFTGKTQDGLETNWYFYELENGKSYASQIEIKDKANHSANLKLFEADTIAIENKAPYIGEIHLIDPTDNQIVDEIISSSEHITGRQSFFNKKLKLIVKADDAGVNDVVSGIKAVCWQYAENRNDILYCSSTTSIRGEEWYVFDLDTDQDISYQFRIYAVDNSGNISADAVTFEKIEKLVLETKTPRIENIELLQIVRNKEKANEDTENDAGIKESLEPLETFVREDKMGYFNKPVRVRIKTNDSSNGSGIYSVIMNDSVQMRAETVTEEVQTEEGVTTRQVVTYYSTDLEPGEIYDLNFAVKDTAGNEWKDNAGNFWQEQAENAETSESLFSGLSRLMLENISPSASYTMPDRDVEAAYYGLDVKDKNILIDLRDYTETGISSSVESFTLIDEYEDRTIDYSEDNYKVSKNNSGVWTIKIPMSGFENQDGNHTLNVEVTDKAGNKFRRTQTFKIDYTAPSAANENTPILLTEAPESKIIDDSMWFKGTDNIQIKAEVKEANIDNMTVTIKGKTEKVIVFKPDNENETEKITVENDLNTIRFALNQQDFPVNDDKTYRIEIRVLDLAGNTVNEEMILHRDFDEPVIEKVMVNKINPNSTIGILFRNFGIFANANVSLRIKASDSAYDSGMEKVTIGYVGLRSRSSDSRDPQSYSVNGNPKWQESEELYYDEKENVYVCILSMKEEDLKNHEFKRNVKITAYDKFGRKNSALGNAVISGNGDKDTSSYTEDIYFCLESEAPTIKINIPKEKGYEDKNGVWFGNEQRIGLEVTDSGSGIREMEVKLYYYENGKKNEGMPITKDSKNKAFLTSSYTETSRSAITSTQRYVLTTTDVVSIAQKNGKYEIEVTVTDNSGNKEKETASFNYDTTKPTVERFTLNPVSQYGKNTDVSEIRQWVEQDPSYGFYFKRDFDVSVYTTDGEYCSGVETVYYQLVKAGDKLSDKWEELNNGVIHVQANFKGQIYVYAVDHVNNACGKVTPKSFVIDTTEQHKKEGNHIVISEMTKTNLKDMKKQPLYTGEVKFKVTIKDMISGIQSFKYQTTSENTSGDDRQEKKYVFEKNTRYQINQKLKDGWVVTGMDQNLVTKVEKEYQFIKDDNDIQVSFSMIDRAGNEDILSGKDINAFTIDKTAPVIDVDFEGNGQYYQKTRTGTITVTERNFDEKRITTTIKNTLHDKQIPEIKFNRVGTSNTYKAGVTFSEGDYQFDIKGTDLGGHIAQVKYKNGERYSKSFYVDGTQPVFEGWKGIEFSSSDSSPKLYNQDQKVTVKVREHHFDPNAIDVSVIKNNGNPTKQNDLKWKSEGDTHTTEIEFKEEGVYHLMISGNDKAGNELKTDESGFFEIDKTKPVFSLNWGSNNDNNVYATKRSGQVTVTERNLDKVVLKCQKNGSTEEVTLKSNNSENDSHSFDFELGEGDYSSFTISGKDRAGNEEETKPEINPFSVDATAPVAEIKNIDDFADGKLYKEGQTITISVTEHNFDSNAIDVSVIKNNENPTKQNNDWKSEGDTHTTSIQFEKDGVYQLNISGKDKAGHAIQDSSGKTELLSTGEFEIDKAAPTASESAETFILTTEEAKEVPAFTFTDASKNMEKITGKLNGYFLKDPVNENNTKVLNNYRKVNNVEINIPKNEKSTKVKSLSVPIKDYFQKSDSSQDQESHFLQGVYTFNLTASDVLDNKLTKTITYVIMDNDYMAYIPSKSYQHYTKNTNTDNIKNSISGENPVPLELNIYMRENDKMFQLKMVASDIDPVVIYSTENNSAGDCISCDVDGYSGYKHYKIAFNERLADTLSKLLEDSKASEKDISLLLTLTDSDDNKSEDSQQLITFKIDNETPNAQVENRMQEVAKYSWIDGYYGSLPITFEIINIPSDLDLNKCEFKDNDKTMKKDVDYKVNKEDNKIIVTVYEEGEHRFEFTIADKVGNKQTVQIGKNPVYFGSVFGHLHWLFIIGGSLILGGIVWLVVFLVRRKKSKS